MRIECKQRVFLTSTFSLSSFFSLPPPSPLPSSISAGAVDHLGIEFMGKKKKALSYWHSDESCLESLYEPRWLCICFVQSCFSFYCMCLNVNVPVISFDCALYVGQNVVFPSWLLTTKSFYKDSHHKCGSHLRRCNIWSIRLLHSRLTGRELTRS